jgi:hypothetical protein
MSRSRSSFFRSWFTRRAAVVLAFAASMALAVIVCGDDKPKPPGPGKDPQSAAAAMEACWADLEKDETAATSALLNLADRRDETVALLKAKTRARDEAGSRNV